MSLLTSSLTGPLTSGVTTGPTPILLMPLVSNLNLSIGIGSATFTRSTTGTFVDPGTVSVTSAAINAARFEANGVLIEGASTNQLLESEDLTGGSTTLTRVTVGASTNTFSVPMQKVIPTVANLSHWYGQFSNVVSGTVYTQTFYAADEGYGFVQITGSAGFNTSWINIDLSDGSIGNSAAGSAVVDVEEINTGVFRIAYTDTAISTTLGRLLIATLNADTASRLPAFAGDGTSGLSIAGNGLEPLPFASSYIPTTTTTISRTSDNLSIDSDNIPVPANDYTVSLKSDAIGFDSSASQVLFNVVGETSRRIEWNTTTGAIEATHGAVTSTSTSTFNPGDRVDIAFVVDDTNQTLYIDGVEEDQDAKGTVTGTKTSINIGRQASTSQAYSHIKPLQIFDIALTADEVASL